MADEIINTDYPGDVRPPEYTGHAWREIVYKRISWPAIFGGTFVALGTELLFLAFGLFIGFSMYNPATEANPGAGISAWTIAWYLVTCACALFAGGWVAAKLAGNPERGRGMLHGIVTWGLTTVTTVTLFSMVTWNILMGGAGLLRTAAVASTALAPTAAQTTTTGEAARMEQQAANALRQASENAPYAANIAANTISGLSLVIFGGILLGAITAVAGGAVGRSAPRPVR